MRVGVVIPTYDQYGNASAFRRLVELLEELGYHSAWFGDHIILPDYAATYMDPSWLEAVTCAVNGLGMTSRLSFGMDVLVAPYRDPILLAKMTATASLLSSGRFILGLGIGWMRGEFAALGVPPFEQRAQVTEEYLRVIRLLFEAQGPVSYNGEWIKFENAHFGPRLIPPPPILVGGNHDKALRRAALLGDGWHPLFMPERQYAECRAKILDIRAKEGITRPFTFSYSGFQARILASGVPPLREGHTGEGAPADATYIPSIPRDGEGRQRFTGTPEQIREDCKVFAQAGVEQLVIRFAFPHDPDIGPEQHENQLRLFATEVLPYCGSL